MSATRFYASRVFLRGFANQAQSIPLKIPKPAVVPSTVAASTLSDPIRVVWAPRLINMAIKEASAARRLKCHSLPCVLMRAGTSKGMFLHRKDLPENEAEWGPILVSALGSRGNDPRQIDGIGGGTSTTSKVAVVSPSSRPGIDVDFTFVQVAVGKESVDFTGNCGNMVSGVGAFSVQEGLVQPKDGQDKVLADIQFFKPSLLC